MLIVAAAAAGLICAFAVFGGLSLLGRPADFQSRLASLDDRISGARSVLRQAGAAEAYPEGALCALSPQQAKAAIDAALKQAIAREKPSTATFAVVPERPNRKLAALGISLKAQGRQDQVLNLLADLARSKPVLFIDVIELSPSGPSMQLNLQGHVYCSA